jgi:predicted small metal-binding protein
MAKMLRCRDAGVDCDAVIRAETEEELMRKVAEHAKTVHGMTEIPADLVAKVKAAIKDV